MNELIKSQALEFTRELSDVVKNRFMSLGGQIRPCDLVNENFTHLYTGTKDTYNPIIGGASLGFKINKVIFQSKSDPKVYLVALESGTYLVRSDRFVLTKPFRKNIVEKISGSIF